MAQTKDIPPANLPDQVQAAVALGATSIKCTKQADGNWTLETN